MEHSLVLVHLAVYSLIILSAFAFYEYGRSKRKIIKNLGLLFAFFLCLLYGFQCHHLYYLQARLQKTNEAVIAQERVFKRFVLTFQEYLEAIKKDKKADWQDEIAPVASLSECILASESIESIVATETLINLGENK